MITKERTGRTIRNTFDSVAEYAASCEGNLSEVMHVMRSGSDWAFGEYGHQITDAFEMARLGWQTKTDEVVNLAEEMVKAVETEVELPKWEPTWDVSGGAVDVGAFLSGVPECMIEYPINPVASIGRVVTICTSVSASGAVDGEELIKRGTMITALAMLLETLGYNTEIWADLSASGDGYKLYERVLVKSANDMIDASRVAFAVANPSFLRVLGFASMHNLPADFQRGLAVGSGYGMPTRPESNLPEGTLYMNEVYGYTNYDAKAELIDNLRKLGIIE